MDLPNYLGYPSNTKTNVGTIEARGWDFEIGYQKSDWRVELFHVNLNGAISNTEIIDVGGIETFTVASGTQIHTLGAAFAEWFGYESNGLIPNSRRY